MSLLIFTYNEHVYFAIHCIQVDYIISRVFVIMTGINSEENLYESNFGHTEDEWGSVRKFTGKEKKYCECLACKDTMEKRKKNLDTNRIVAYKLND